MLRQSLALVMVLLCAGAFHVPAAVLISEFMSANTGGVLDEDGDSPDWIELHNDASTVVSLAGWHLTDNLADLTRWTFPATNLPAGGYVVVFASGKNRAVAGAELHTSFQLSSSGEIGRAHV